MKITPSAAAPENYEYHADEAILRPKSSKTGFRVALIGFTIFS